MDDLWYENRVFFQRKNDTSYENRLTLIIYSLFSIVSIHLVQKLECSELWKKSAPFLGFSAY